MSVKYSRLPTDEDKDSTAIDFSSYFTYENPPKYFSYSTKSAEFQSIFTYKKSKDNAKSEVQYGKSILNYNKKL